jgi:hypothetical protein
VIETVILAKLLARPAVEAAACKPALNHGLARLHEVAAVGETCDLVLGLGHGAKRAECREDWNMLRLNAEQDQITRDSQRLYTEQARTARTENRLLTEQSRIARDRQRLYTEQARTARTENRLLTEQSRRQHQLEFPL